MVGEWEGRRSSSPLLQSSSTRFSPPAGKMTRRPLMSVDTMVLSSGVGKLSFRLIGFSARRRFICFWLFCYVVERVEKRKRRES